MKQKLIIIGIIFTTALFVAGCGGGGGASGGGSGGGGENTPGQATVTTLSTIPTLDLSNYDSSTSSNASLSALLPRMGLAAKTFGESRDMVGGNSRAGCEANMHKKEMIRASQIAQISRCYPEVMAKDEINLIEIPDGSYNYYSLTPPETVEVANMCDDIPEVETEEKEMCEAGRGGNKAGIGMRMRIGIIDGELRIDMCEDAGGGNFSLVDESTYTASGSRYTADVTHIGSWEGKNEKNNITLRAELGATGTVEDGIVTGLGTDGWVIAEGSHIGPSGAGYQYFEYVGEDASNLVKGAFAGDFTDPYTSTRSTFTGTVFSRFGGTSNTGCAKFKFVGTMPPIRVQDLLPFNISEDQLDAFLAALGVKLGIAIGGVTALNSTNYQDVRLCENPRFDPTDPGSTINPVVLMTGDSCGEVTHTGTECFSITNVTEVGDFGNDVTQIFLTIASDGSPYYTEVSGFDLGTLSESITTPAYVGNWNCSGTFTDIDFASVDPEELQAAMSECLVMEEKAFRNRGMGEYNCGEQEHVDGVNTLASEGGWAENFGKYGGDYSLAMDLGNNCVLIQNPVCRRLFVNAINADEGKYCIASRDICQPFTVAEPGGGVPPALADGTPDTDNGKIELIHGRDDENLEAEIRHLRYRNNTINPSMGDYIVIVTYGVAGGGTCVQTYFVEKHDFGAPQEFAGEDFQVPAPCIDPVTNQPVPENVCRQICSRPENFNLCKPGRE